MKPTKLFLMTGLLAASTCAFWACGDDGWGSVDGAAPVMDLSATHIKSAIGRTFTVTGTLTDNDGISNVKLYCPELYLNKTIDIIDIYGEPLKTYDLNYSFPVASTETGDNFKIEVTVTDVCGQQVTKEVLVTMDGDFEAPVFAAAPGSEVTLIMKARTNYNLNVTVTDDQGLDYLLVQIPGHETLNDGVTYACGGSKSFDYSERIAFPNVEQSYHLYLTVVDLEGKKTTKESVISVTSEVPDYANLWLADVATATELNADIFGVPQYVDHAIDEVTGDSIPYTYVARYYNEKAGTKVWFLGQKTDFSPICYGCDATDASLLSDDEEGMQAITLNEAGVYYKITINIKNYTMQTETYPVSQATAAFRTDLYGTDSFDVWGEGSWLYNFTIGYLNSGPSGVVSFKQDQQNPNLFYLEEPLTFDADNNLQNNDGEYNTNFIIHNYHPGGWWDVVCYKPNSKEDPEFWPWWGNNSQLVTEGWTEWAGYTKVRNSGDKWCKVPVPTSKFGKYRLYFDAHLERAKLVPAN